MIENSRPVVALIRLIGWATSAPSRREERALAHATLAGAPRSDRRRNR